MSQYQNPYQPSQSTRQTYSGDTPLSRPVSRNSSRPSSPHPGGHSHKSVVPDSQDDMVHLPPTPIVAPPQLDSALLKAVRAIEKFPTNFNKSPAAELFRGSALCKFTEAMAQLAPSPDELFSNIHNIPKFTDIFDDLEARAAASRGDAEMTSDNDEAADPAPDVGLGMFGSIPSAAKLKNAENPLPARLSSIERTLVAIQATVTSLVSCPAPTSPTVAFPIGQSSKGPKNPAKGSLGPKGKNPTTPSKDAPPPQGVTSTTTTTTPAVEVVTQIKPKDSYASKAEPSAFRKKVRDPQPFGEVLFSPTDPFLPDQDPGPAVGQGLKWTPHGNVLLTPTTPEQWDILVSNGAAALTHLHQGKSFKTLSHGPTRDLVLHGWPAKSTALPNVDTTLLSIAHALDLDPHDVVKDKCRWLVSAKNPNPARNPLLLVALSTNESQTSARGAGRSDTPPGTVASKPWFVAIAQMATTEKHYCGTCMEKKGCAHLPLQCPICQGNHVAWSPPCIERQIQKAANPPKKKAAPPPKAAGLDSPAWALAKFVRQIPEDRLGHAHRNTTKYSDTELVKKFRSWCIYNKLPFPTLVEGIHSLVTALDCTSDTHHALVVTELPWHNIGAGNKGAPKHRDWILALALSPLPVGASPQVGIFINKKLLPDHNLVIHPLTFNSLNAAHVSIQVHGRRINIVGIYRPPSETSLDDPNETLSKIVNWDAPLADTIILGDFNLHHSAWDVRAKDEGKGKCFLSWAKEEGLYLHSDPSTPTWISPSSNRKDTVVDLALSNPGMRFNWTVKWEVDKVVRGPWFILGDVTCQKRYEAENCKIP
ncbi:hypothetical protein BOTBODRAFT_172985 [Botryobasidium botryosum FD-172 SS1]|uniref:Endonuclease/exonuclease/phosphatase domain-containing protein n=1 Tax=Botryobasidium botryosum (strain FD-172 SS1) TaxID=930990 RepID=A0A067MP15_BOTB1|nr:hypothetical protein BOTBODRAFT_172985 [Botryobasidium botryosum FD-172 SS1]